MMLAVLEQTLIGECPVVAGFNVEVGSFHGFPSWDRISTKDVAAAPVFSRQDHWVVDRLP
jgi:hypothetical protein